MNGYEAHVKSTNKATKAVEATIKQVEDKLAARTVAIEALQKELAGLP